MRSRGYFKISDALHVDMFGINKATRLAHMYSHQSHADRIRCLFSTSFFLFWTRKFIVKTRDSTANRTDVAKRSK